MKKIISCCAAICSAAVAAAPSKGALCLTFDDRSFMLWERALPLFAKYDARATFFISGPVEKRALACMKKLQAAGHTVGLHGLRHTRAVNFAEKYGADEYVAREIMPQLTVCRENGIRIRAFAYPYSQQNEATDKALFTVFDFLRTNCTSVKQPETPLAKADRVFVKKVAKKQLFYGFPSSGPFNMAEVKAAIDRAAANGETIVFYAHKIMAKPAKSHHISRKQLEELLKYSTEKGLPVIGMNEL